MLNINKTTLAKVKEINLKNIFPDITDEMQQLIEDKASLKMKVIDYVKRDRIGVQYNAVRLCKIPSDPKPLEEKIEELEFELDNADDDSDDKRIKNKKKELWKLKKEFEKLKNPYKYFDDICECYKACPLYRGGIPPVNEPCYFEVRKVAQSTESYVNEFEIDMLTENIAKEQIAQIVLCDLIIYRASRALATENLSTINEKHGEMGVEYTKQRNNLLSVISEQIKIRNKLLETMLGTPEIRRKYKMDNNKNMRQAEAENKVTEMIKNRESFEHNTTPTLITFEDAEVVK